MSKVKGTFIICNRCKTEGFQKLYEDYPDGWLYVSHLGDLCPECAKIFKSFIKHFMGVEDIAPEWIINDSELVNMTCISNDITFKTPPTELRRSED